jgi:predicted HAD superfamily phosphohydrolase YqeG
MRVKTMTYRELLEELKQLTPTQLEQDVTVYLSDLDEYIAAWEVGVADEEQSVLDEDHIFLTV